jgi:hypothetical protein
MTFVFTPETKSASDTTCRYASVICVIIHTIGRVAFLVLAVEHPRNPSSYFKSLGLSQARAKQ